MRELVELERPQLPEHWDYDESVGRTKQLAVTWRNVTGEFLTGLWVAREMLSKPGARTDLNPKQTWGNYCRESQLEKRTVNRWLLRAFAATPSRQVPRAPVTPPIGTYRTIVIDPPWPVEKIEREERPRQTRELDYPTMTLEEIGQPPPHEAATGACGRAAGESSGWPAQSCFVR